MLVLTRKKNEQIFIGDGIVVEVVEVSGSRVKLGITAPQSQRISRAEQIGRPNKAAETAAKTAVGTISEI
jgi:carbon storage regulator